MGEPGGTRTPDLLVRRFGFEILTALSVCQLRVGRFEICPLIGLHGLQHLGLCATKWPSQSAAISIQRFAVPYIFIGETPAPRCARVCAASAPARKAIRLAATRLWQKVARANPVHCRTLCSRLSAPGVYGGNKGQASAVPTGSSPSLRTGVLRGESDDQFLARHPVRISHAFQ